VKTSNLMDEYRFDTLHILISPKPFMAKCTRPSVPKADEPGWALQPTWTTWRSDENPWPKLRPIGRPAPSQSLYRLTHQLITGTLGHISTPFPNLLMSTASKTPFLRVFRQLWRVLAKKSCSGVGHDYLRKAATPAENQPHTA
jgi:hypothetical protein